jgi:transcriptional regulator with XRE-family HTH domain
MRSPFGDYLRKKREEEHLTLRHTAEEVGIVPAYLSDIEKGRRNPFDRHPDMMERFEKALHLSQEDITTLYDLAALERQPGHQVPVDLSEYLREQPDIRDFVRTARKQGLSEENWKSLTAKVTRLSKEQTAEKVSNTISLEGRNPFGGYVRKKREEQHLTLRGTAAELGITPAYLSDIEKGRRNPFTDAEKLQSLSKILKLSESETHTLYDISALNYAHNYEGEIQYTGDQTPECPADLRQYLSNNPAVRTFVRAAGAKDLSKAQWQELTKTVQQKREVGLDVKENAPKRHYIKKRPSPSKDKDRGR